MNTTIPTKFTEEMIIEWLGDPDWSYSGIVETFMDLANGDYTVENMRKDILELREAFINATGNDNWSIRLIHAWRYIHPDFDRSLPVREGTLTW